MRKCTASAASTVRKKASSGSKAAKPVEAGDLYHDIVHSLPEVLQHLPGLAVDARHEIAEQQAEENQSQHLTLRGRRDDVGRNHAQEDVHHVADTTTLDPLRDGIDVFGYRQDIAGRLAIDDAGGNDIDQQQTHKNGEQAGGHVIQQCLATEPAHGPAFPDAGYTGNDRGEDQRHDEHFQGIQEQLAEKDVDVVETQPEQAAVHAGQLAGDDGQYQGEQDLPMQFHGAGDLADGCNCPGTISYPAPEW
jgi:hypothetical protein